jgi:hypothetical protein
MFPPILFELGFFFSGFLDVHNQFPAIVFLFGKRVRNGCGTDVPGLSVT